MGVYDSVVGRCTCGAFLEWQSKADECLMREFSANCYLPIPINIVEEVTGNDRRGGEQKCRCGKTWKLVINTRREYGTVDLVEVNKECKKTDKEEIEELRRTIRAANKVIRVSELNSHASTLYETWKTKKVKEIIGE